MQRSTRRINQTEWWLADLFCKDARIRSHWTGSVINKTGCKAGTTAKGQIY